MKNRILLIGGILFCCVFSVKTQESCKHDTLIITFLEKISALNYDPLLKDYNTYFDNHSEIEIGLRDMFFRNNPNSNLSDKPNSRSLTIEQLIHNKIVSDLIILKNNKKCKWKIFNRYTKGSSTIVYVVGLDCSKEIIKIQMVNWAYKNRCGICDITDLNDNTIINIWHL